MTKFSFSQQETEGMHVICCLLGMKERIILSVDQSIIIVIKMGHGVHILVGMVELDDSRGNSYTSRDDSDER